MLHDSLKLDEPNCVKLSPSEEGCCGLECKAHQEEPHSEMDLFEAIIKFKYKKLVKRGRRKGRKGVEHAYPKLWAAGNQYLRKREKP
ncbi:hypothetical protein QUC31_017951 [Theobroma cacao]